MDNSKHREIWIDDVKIIACVLVVLGHFFQSMVKSGLMEDISLYRWFNSTIYYIHVQLFFICSGYLYQKLTRITDVKSWVRNVSKKFLVLGIPYFVFSILTWGLKSLFPNYINEGVGNFIESLFVHPLSPYWYLYVLFFVFLITPTLNNKWVAICVVTIMLLLVFSPISYRIERYQMLALVLHNEIWFVAGMLLCFVRKKVKFDGKIMFIGTIMLAIFFICSGLIYKGRLALQYESLLMGAMGCFGVIFFIGGLTHDSMEFILIRFISRYTFHIFLLHTIFAATFRVLLLCCGIRNSVIHIVVGISVSFVGPILVGYISGRIKGLDFIFYPNKYIEL